MDLSRKDPNTGSTNLGSPRPGEGFGIEDQIILKMIDSERLDDFRDDRLRTDSL